MLDRTRLEAGRRPGTDAVDVNATFQEGDLLIFGANGWTTSLSGSTAGIRGIAALNKSSARYQPVIGEQVTLSGTTAQNLLNAPLVDTSIRVYSGATVYALTTDYTVNATNGTVTRVGTGSITDGETVSVDYSYQMTEVEQDDQGRPIANIVDETAASGKAEVIREPATVYLTNYDPGPGFTLGGIVYDNGDGRLTSTVGSNVAVGRCKQVPSASDPYLGIEFKGSV